MNSLSWVLYLADIIGSFANTIGFFSFFGIVFIFGLTLFFGFQCDTGDREAGTWTKPLGYLWIPILCFILISFVPSKQTIYMIAASEVGETVVNNPQTQSMVNDLSSLIQKKLKEQLED
tara:strand:- start:1038 stop:1394 length:357 start_codon:yes stop_codon:yes gene_type:complete